ncbi:hypothetical protein SCB49_11062 [unidentified eubacterium SCB49]|nr:hypothetical protein SCB49_11062 [unidentified eubacterium SCB49]
MNYQIKPRTSDVLLTIYIVLTLFYRLKFENEAGVSAIQSLVIGLCLIAMPWALIKLKILNPDYFNLLNPKNSKQ